MLSELLAADTPTKQVNYRQSPYLNAVGIVNIKTSRNKHGYLLCIDTLWPITCDGLVQVYGRCIWVSCLDHVVLGGSLSALPGRSRNLPSTVLYLLQNLRKLLCNIKGQERPSHDLY